MARPPPAKPVSQRVRKGFQALAANQEKMEQIRKNAENSKYFDGSAPMTRNKRSQARSYFEMFVESCYELTEPEDVWAPEHFTMRTKQFLEGVTNIAKGKFEEKIKTPTLWSYKHALYWWAAVLVPDFHLLWQKWHTEVSRHIHQLGVQESLSTRSWKKSNLGDSELVLIFDYIMEQRYGVDNLKQHWAALLLVWLTAARPGSITVSEGYGKGAALGIPGKVREVSDTLRWSDVEFVNMKDGIAVRINFKHHKGYRNPNQDGARSSDAKRTFLFLPTTGERLEFDLPLILFGIAYQRGLFVQTLEEMIDGEPSEIFLQKKDDVDSQAVFVASDQSGRLSPAKPMSIQALNPKLQQLCAGVGLMERNTYYSLRRTAIIEVRRKHGTDKAKDLAFHVASANSLFFYDNVGFGDVDMQQFRQGGPETMTRDDVQKYFSQANLARWPAAKEDGLSLKGEIEQAVAEQLIQHEEYIQKNVELKNLYEKAGDKLEAMQTAGIIPDTELIPKGYSSKDGTKYKTLCIRYGLDEVTKSIEEFLKDRKALFRKLRLQLRKSTYEELRKKHRAVLADSQKQANRKLSEGGGYEPRAIQDAEVTGLVRDAQDTDFEEYDPEADQSDDEGADGANDEVLEDQRMTSREEPDSWSDLTKEVIVQLGQGDSSAESVDTRRVFLLKWINFSDSVVGQSNLLCPRCQIDPTMDKASKEKRYNLYKLNTHMRGTVHVRENQLRRALKLDGHTNSTGVIVCPVCELLPCKGIRGLIKHIKESHPEQLWDDLEDENGSANATSDVTDFEGFSDVHDEGGVLEEGRAVEEDAGVDEESDGSEFGGFSPANKGKDKGKGRML